MRFERTSTKLRRWRALHNSEEGREFVHAQQVAELQEGRRLPWLLFFLACSVVAALVATRLEERIDAQSDLQAARDELDIVQQQRASLARQLVSAHALVRVKDEAASDLLLRTGNAQAIQQQNEKLINELKAKLGGQDGEVSVEANRVRVDLVDRILFRSGDAELSVGGMKLLSRLGAVLKKVDDKQILVGGHTDNQPIHTDRFPSNWELSAARAVNVARYLTEEAGVDPARVAAAAYSQFHPRDRLRAGNRRIEILLTPFARPAPPPSTTPTPATRVSRRRLIR
jgi:chemotaxis protein MotB